MILKLCELYYENGIGHCNLIQTKMNFSEFFVAETLSNKERS